MITKYFVLVSTFMIMALILANFAVAESQVKQTVAVVNRQSYDVAAPSKNTFSMYMLRAWNWFGSAIGLTDGPRTFGHIRRLKNALIPLMFKFGVIATLIAVLVFLALKTIFLLKAILVLNAGVILAKLIAFKSSSGNDHHHYSAPPVWHQPAPNWHQFGASPYFASPHSQLPWASTVGQGKEIHVHIHNAVPQVKSNSIGWESEPYGGHSELQKQYVVNPNQIQQQPQQQLVQIHRDDQLNYVNSRRYGLSLRRR